MAQRYVFRFPSTKDGFYLLWDSPGNLKAIEVPLNQAKVSTNQYYFLDHINNPHIIAVPIEVAEAIDS